MLFSSPLENNSDYVGTTVTASSISLRARLIVIDRAAFADSAIGIGTGTARVDRRAISIERNSGATSIPIGIDIVPTFSLIAARTQGDRGCDLLC